ncbi:MAG: FHA domain-containing protein [Proteobacteria bacterium]|nr:FHA domain-containing protein [Pseudomonadota bacterium]
MLPQLSHRTRNMKHPTPGDHLNRRDAADEATIIIGAEDASNETVIAPQTSPDPLGNQKPLTADTGGYTRIQLPRTGGEELRMDPVVGWLVVLSGPGKGNFRPIYPGSNTIGRSSKQRIPIDFGDDSISSEKQAFLVYDGRKRQFQLVPNLEKTNLVHLNDSAVLTNGELKAHDKITMGDTTLLFVPLCGPEFDWSEAK